LELFETLKKRRAIRQFTPEPLSDDILKRLAYAAKRAPTGGNNPSRRILVVKDPKTIRLIRQVAPGVLGAPAALLVVFTDLDVASSELGKLGNVVSTLDAGAAAENVALAAVDLGIGACFTKSYSEAALKELLNIPDHCRTEVMLQLGHPQSEQPRSMRPRKGADTVYLDAYGRSWNA
jgi:nitroreductase